MTPATLVLLRHGASTWTVEDRFAGWVDVPLCPRGRIEAHRAGLELHTAGLFPDAVYTSVLTRAVSTARIVLAAMGRRGTPTHNSWRLNERHYGALQGRRRAEVHAEVGADQLSRWRRAVDVAPPPMPPDSPFGQADDPRYIGLGAALPTTESPRDVTARLLPYWESAIAPQLRAGRTVLVVSHGNTLRAIVRHLAETPDANLEGLRISTGTALRFDLDDRLRPLVPGGTSLQSGRHSLVSSST